MKNLYQLYIDNGNQAGFKVRRGGWGKAVGPESFLSRRSKRPKGNFLAMSLTMETPLCSLISRTRGRLKMPHVLVPINGRSLIDCPRLSLLPAILRFLIDLHLSFGHCRFLTQQNWALHGTLLRGCHCRSLVRYGQETKSKTGHLSGGNRPNLGLPR